MKCMKLFTIFRNYIAILKSLSQSLQLKVFILFSISDIVEDRNHITHWNHKMEICEIKGDMQFLCTCADKCQSVSIGIGFKLNIALSLHAGHPHLEKHQRIRSTYTQLLQDH